MTHPAPIQHNAPVPTSTPRRARLLAVRLAGAAFEGLFRVRSSRFEALLATWESLGEELDNRRDALVEALYSAVPLATDKATRGRLLKIKRYLFNGRPLGSLPKDGLPGNLQAELADLEHLTELRERLFDAGRTTVLAEQRERLAEILENERFRLAYRYASPGLAEALERRGLPETPSFSALERGLYTYAARFLSKANPFHVFAEIAFPPTTAIPVEQDHEILVDTAVLFEAERGLVERARDTAPERLWLQMRTVERRDGTYRFWLPVEDGYHLYQLPADDFSDLLVEFFANCRRWHGKPCGTLEDWRGFILARRSKDLLDAAEKHLAELIRCGAVSEYLLTDLTDLTDLSDLEGSLATLDPERKEDLAVLRRHHLQCTATSDLEQIHNELSRAVSQVAPQARDDAAAQGGNGYFVNSYRRLDTADCERAATELEDDLTALKPLFAARHNFSTYGDVLRAYMVNYVQRRSYGKATPYLEILRHFLRHRYQVIASFQPSRVLPADELRSLERWQARLKALQGSLSRAEVESLSDVPWTPASPPSLCFNGPFDFIDRTFYTSNVFAGGGRFAARYLLHRRAVPGNQPHEVGEHFSATLSSGTPDVLDVELAVPPSPNLNLVVRTAAIGCGFETRYAHRYERWIDPGEILVGVEAGKLIYRHGPSRARLRLRYSGFLLAPFLPVEYQLLLTDHADSFFNPFLDRPDSAEPGLQHHPALTFGNVCLRRRRWTLGQAVLAEMPTDSDDLRFTALLRRFLHQRLETKADLWYYQRLDAAGRGDKPRFLDLRNPLSAFALRRDLNALSSGEGALTLSALQPTAAHLLSRGGRPFMAELMIEV